MSPARNPGRVAGIWYLLLILVGPLRLLYIPAKLFVHDDAAATVSNIAAHEWLFRSGIMGDLVGALILIMLTLAFYKLFKGLDQNLAVQVVIFGGVVPSIFYFVNAAGDLGVLRVLHGTLYLSAFAKPQREAFAMMLLNLEDHLFTVSMILAGVWLWPLAALVYRSRFLPRFLGVWLAIGGFCYVILCFAGVLLPQYQERVFNYSQPAFFGEIALTLWLLIKGAKPAAFDATRPSSSGG